MEKQEMSVITPEFQAQIVAAFESLKASQTNEQTFGKGFILARADSPQIENLKKNGEVLNSLKIEDIDLLIISPGINE